MASLTEYKDFGQGIYHFRKIADVDQSQFADVLDPIVVIAEDDAGKHTQIKVLPFNALNDDKKTLSFKDKVQYFQRTIRERYGKNVIAELVANTGVVALQIDLIDVVTNLTTDEMTEFLSGFNTLFNTGYTMDNFFGSMYLDLDPQTLADFTAGINGGL